MGKIELGAKQSSLAFVLGFVFCQLAGAIFTLVGFSINQMISGNSEWFEAFLSSSAWGLLIKTIIMELVFIGVFVFFNKPTSEKIIAKPNAKKMLIYAAIGVVSFFCLFPIITCVDTLLASWGITSDGVSINTTSEFIIGIFSLAILPAIGEELLFRGIIFRGFKGYGKALSIILTALCFAIFHMSPYQLIYPILFGLLLSGIMYKENNIIYTIAVHFINNFLVLIVNFLNIPLSYKHFSYIILAIVLCVAFLTAVLLFAFNKNKGSKTKNFGKDKYWVLGAFAIMLVFWIVSVASA